MEGVISNFRIGKRTQYHYQMIIHPSGIEKLEEAKKLIGKKVVWKSPAGKEISGTVAKEHGRKGAVRVRFEKGMPGQAIGAKVTIG